VDEIRKSQIRRAECREEKNVELEEVIKKATTKKKIIVKGTKGTKINRNSLVEVKGRERTENERSGG
jgi:hypothetical protein